MAIIVEQEKSNNRVLKIIGAVVGVTVLIAGIYFLFLKPAPQDVSEKPSTRLSEVTKIADLEININREIPKVSQDPIFKNLQDHVGRLEVGIHGRANPFAPF